MGKWKVPLADIQFGAEELQAISRVLDSKWLSMGPVTEEFEERFAEYVGTKYAFAVANCTAALHLAHLSLGLTRGDKVICPSLTFVATANSIRYTGATPIFADIISDNNLNISEEDIILKIDDRTKGICVVHYGGYPCNMEKIKKIAEDNNLYIVEDAAHAAGSSYLSPGLLSTIDAENITHDNAISCGAIGDIGCFSFFSNKNMTTAEGGMITTNRSDLADKLRILRSHGMTSLTWDRDRGHTFSYDVVELGYNYRIDEIRSALGISQLDSLHKNNIARNNIVSDYNNLLKNVDEIIIPFQ